MAFTAIPRGPQVVLARRRRVRGAALDVGSWFLTRAWGAPFEYGVMLRGGLFGLATGGMVAVVLDEVALARPPGGAAPSGNEA